MLIGMEVMKTFKDKQPFIWQLIDPPYGNWGGEDGSKNHRGVK